MRVTIHQPEHMPWLGLFHKISQSDVFVALDNVQYRHKYFQNRNRIRCASGSVWMNVPILRKGKRYNLIKDTLINNSETRWRQKSLNALSLNYGKAPFFSKYFDYFNRLYSQDWELLIDINLDIIKNCLDFLGKKVGIIRASDLNLESTGSRLVLDICIAFKADVYISGISGIAGKGKEFEGVFSDHGIKVIYDEFHHPIYKQVYDPFIPCMSIVDLLFNHGDKSLDIINGVDMPVMQEIFY